MFLNLGPETLLSAWQSRSSQTICIINDCLHDPKLFHLVTFIIIIIFLSVTSSENFKNSSLYDLVGANTDRVNQGKRLFSQLYKSNRVISQRNSNPYLNYFPDLVGLKHNEYGAANL